jgi:hypothetical protein
MRNIHESNPNWFENEEAASEVGEDGLCPVCGCCSLVEAEVMPGSIFTKRISGTHSGPGVVGWM